MYLEHLWAAVAPARDPIPPVLTYESFATYEGFLTLTLEPRRLGARLEPWTIPGSLASELQTHSIVGGLFIHSRAVSILQNREQNRIAGLMMDTTWSVMRQYVTSILVAVSRNTAIPLGLAFGPAETSELYEQFYTGFSSHGVDLANFIIESDQGPALISFCERHGITRRFCLHHFLRTLKDPIFAVYVGDIVPARTDIELQLLFERYSVQLADKLRQEPDLTKQAIKQLAKAGLGLTAGHQIFVQDELRWQQVSMLVRIHEEMPPTTNCLESIHGHLNESTPRNNTFWASMCRLGAQMVRSVSGYGFAVRHNFNHACRKAQDIARMIRGSPESFAQMGYFQTEADHCLCGQIVHLSMMYNIDIPCAHRLLAGAERPKMYELPKLEMEREVEALEVHYDVRDGIVPPAGDERRNYLMELAMNNIRRSSKTRKSKKVVMAWVAENYPPDIGGEFALGIPMSVLELILAGVALFAVS
jgi:hypothetical protein